MKTTIAQAKKDIEDKVKKLQARLDQPDIAAEERAELVEEKMILSTDYVFLDSMASDDDVIEQ